MVVFKAPYPGWMAGLTAKLTAKLIACLFILVTGALSLTTLALSLHSPPSDQTWSTSALSLLCCALSAYLPMAHRSLSQLAPDNPSLSQLAPDNKSTSQLAPDNKSTSQLAPDNGSTPPHPSPDHAQEAMLQWLATVSHELRTPLAAVLGTIDRLGMETAPNIRQGHLDNLTRAGALMQSVIDDILDFTKLEHGAVPLQPTSTNLHDLCAGIAALYRPLAEQKQLRLLCEIEGSHDNWLADGARLQQILGNLVANAVKFTDFGDVFLRARVVNADPQLANPDQTCWRFEVQDRGIGIAPDVQGRLFTPYLQADTATASRFGGTGLGLNISRKIVAAMGGRIGVISNPGQGSIFWFEVALTKDHAATSNSVTATAPILPRPDDQTLHILLAEDNIIIRDLMMALLQDAGHQVTCAANGVQALALAQGRLFDLILMDQRMPVLDGAKATRAIRAMSGPQAQTPIVALTADPHFARDPMIADLGFADILIKPIRTARLMRVLMRITADQNMRRNRIVNTAHRQPIATPKDTWAGQLSDDAGLHAKPIGQAIGCHIASPQPAHLAQP